MILTVGMSPCVDVTTRLNTFKFGKTNLAGEKIVTYAGKAINVAMGLARLGGNPFVTGFMYNENGSLFEKTLDKEGIPFCFIWNSGRVRENYKFIDKNGVLTEVNEEGNAVDEKKLYELLDLVRVQAAKSDATIISGGVPKGTPVSYYGNLVEEAKKSPFVVVDTYGERLKEALKVGVDLVKPNLDELSQTLGKEFATREEQLRGAQELVRLGAKNVLLSLGGEGAMLVNDKYAYYCSGKRVEIKSTVGAGDAMVAAATMALIQGQDLPNVLQSGVAAATAAVSEKVGTSITAETYQKIYNALEVIKL